MAGLLATPPALATTLYMAPAGSGSACTPASPCGSMNSAYQAASLGDTVLMAGGTYGGQTISPRSLPGSNGSTPSGDEITFRPQSGAAVTIAGMVLGAVRSTPVEHIAFEDLEFTGWTATRSGQDVHFTRTRHRAQLHANWVEWISYRDGEVGPFVDGTGDGLQFNQIDGRAGHHLLVEGMDIHDIHPNSGAAHPDAIQFYGPYHDATLRGNRLWNNDNINLRGDGTMQRYVVESNFFGPARNPVVTRYYTAQIQGHGAVIRYNSFAGALQPSGPNERSGQLWEGNIMTWTTCGVTGSDSTVRHNVWVGGTSCGSSSKSVGDPGFVDLAGGDLHLRPDSPAIGAGNPGSYPATDIDGEGRAADGAPDAGADELGGGPPPRPPPPDSQAPSAPAVPGSPSQPPGSGTGASPLPLPGLGSSPVTNEPPPAPIDLKRLRRVAQSRRARPPRIGAATMRPPRLCKRPRPACRATGTLRFRLSRRARLAIVVERTGARTRPGHPVLSLRRLGRRGPNVVRLRARSLPRGRYLITVTTTQRGSSQRARVRLRVR